MESTQVPYQQQLEDSDFRPTIGRFQRNHRHTTAGWRSSAQSSINIPPGRERSATIAPSLPPKQKKQVPHKDLVKSQSLDHQAVQRENPYLSLNDIASFPEPSSTRSSRSAVKNVADNEPYFRPPPLTKGIRPRQASPSNIALGAPAAVPAKPPSSPTRFLTNQSDLYTASYKQENTFFRPVSPLQSTSMSPTSCSPETFTYAETKVPQSAKHIQQSSSEFSSELGLKKESNFVADFNRIQHRLFKLYRRIEETPENSTQVAELKVHLRLPEHDTIENILEKIHMSLAPPLQEDLEKKMMYVVDFRGFRDKQDLRHRIIEMFAKPGPPSISYAKVDAKMDSIIAEFCNRVTSMRDTRGDLVESPAHARKILHGVSDGEQLVKALRDNQLWIRWGTVSNLPPLYHLYMHKQPPSYEARKAVTISFITERLKTMPDMMNKIISTNVLCPPIYSRLKADSTKTKWQVTEYSTTTGKFDTHECQFPSWLDDDSTAISLLNSSNRTAFDAGNHPYALYSVYVVIIKDFTLAQEGVARTNEKESSWATPSKVQFYIGSSSTGVLYRFAHVDNSHCARIWKVLSDAPTLRHFRCYEGCDLVEACLALAWARRQPRAVFVLNSFLPRNMSSLSLEQKQPYKEKMLALASHLTDGKKIGPLCDMRYGMNGTTTIQSDEE